MRDEIPPKQRRHVLAEVGGMVDETRASLLIYGDDLDPDAVSALLGCAPSRCHRKGDYHPQSPQQFSTGAWILTVEGKAPSGPSALIEVLLGRFPSDPIFWRSLMERYQVSVRVGIHTGNWNRGFSLAAGTITALARTGIALEFDLYFYDDQPGLARSIH